MLSELGHTQIQHMIQSTLGGRLSAHEKAELEAHLKECAECRSYQAQLLALDFSLRRALHASREGMQSPDHLRSERIVRGIKRRIMFKNKLNFALYGAFLVVMVLVVLFAMRLVTQPGPQPVFPSVPLASPIPSQTPTITQTPTVQAANIIYVKVDAAKSCLSNSVSSWDLPCSLVSALAIASSGMQIWVAAGTYKPTTGTDRAATFTLRSGIEIYGGFAGIETRLDQRNPKNVTILSGDIGTPNDAGNGRAYCDNSYHVVTGSGADATAILDGFTITLGNAYGSSKDGGGMYIDGGSPTLRNLIFSNNGAESFGGGMANYNSNPSLTNVTFSGNSGLGGGMYNYNSSPSLTNVTFSGNLSGWTGGGMANDGGSNPSLTNVTFSGNMGGGMINKNSSPSLTNVTFFGNTGGNGGMTNVEYSKPTLINAILWGDNPEELINYDGSAPNITYSDIQQSQGVYPGTGNINADPLFVNAPGDLHLQPGSPALNAGNNAAIPDEATTDLDGQLRIQGGTVDMGAYEYGPLPEPKVITPEIPLAVTLLNSLGREAINEFAWSPDGKQIAAATSSGIYLVDMTTLAEKQISTATSTVVSFSHDGSLLASAAGSIVKIIDVSSETVLYELKGHTDTIESVAFSPVENILATGSVDTTVRLWDANRGEELHTLAGHDQGTYKVFFSPDGKYLVSTAYEEPSKLWDVASGQELRKFSGPVFTYSPDGTTLAAAYLSGEARIKLWDAASGKELNELTGAANFIEPCKPNCNPGWVPMDVAYSPDGRILATKSLYSHIILWDIYGRVELRTIYTNKEDSLQILFSPDGKQLASASLEVIKVWNTATGELIHTISFGNSCCGYDTQIRSLAFSPKGDILAAGGGPLMLYSVPAGELLGVLDPEFGIINHIAFSPDGNILAVGGGNYNPTEGGIVLWDVQTRKLIWRKVDFPAVVNQVVFNPDGTELAVVYGVGWGALPTVQVYSLKDLLSGSAAAPLYESRVFTPVLYNQDGVLLSLATTVEEGVLQSLSTTAEGKELIPAISAKLKPSLWDIKNSRELAALGGSLAESTVADMIPLSADISPDGSYVLFGAAVGQPGENKVGLNLWNLVSGRQVSLIDDPSDEKLQQITSVDFSPDGRMFAAACFYGGVRIWAVETGKLLAVLDVPPASVVAFSPDGTLIATGSSSDPVRLWGVPVDREAGK